MATPPVRTQTYLDHPHVDLVSATSVSSCSPDPTDYLEPSGPPKRAFSRDRKSSSVKSSRSSKSTKSSKSVKSVKSSRSAKHRNKRASFKHILGKRNKKPTLTDIFLDPDANDSLYTCHATDMLPKPKHYKVRRWKNHKQKPEAYCDSNRDTETDTYYDSLEVRSELRKYVGSRGSTNTTNTRLRYPVGGGGGGSTVYGTGATAVVSGGATTSEMEKSSKSSTNTWTSSWRPAALRMSRYATPEGVTDDPHLLDLEDDHRHHEETPHPAPERETFMQRLRLRFRV